MVFEGLVDFISLNYRGRIVEVGTGRFFKVALELKNRGFDVLCTDIREVETPPGIKFVKDDLFNPDIEIYRDSTLVYSLRPPPELFNPLLSLSRRIKADCIIRPLPAEAPDGCMLINHGGDFFYLSQFDSGKKIIRK